MTRHKTLCMSMSQRPRGRMDKSGILDSRQKCQIDFPDNCTTFLKQYRSLHRYIGMVPTLQQLAALTVRKGSRPPLLADCSGARSSSAGPTDTSDPPLASSATSGEQLRLTNRTPSRVASSSPVALAGGCNTTKPLVGATPTSMLSNRLLLSHYADSTPVGKVPVARSSIASSVGHRRDPLSA